MASSNSLVVAAIDFGTTYSGWAFSFKHEFEADPIKISAKSWTGGQLVSLKGPTCALIKPDGNTLHSFGFEAESKYAELAEEDQHQQWFFFKRFKMMLFDQIGITRDITIEDANGRKFPAKKVFSLCIGYLKNDLIKMSESRISGGGLTNDDIHWVLTVPAIWNDAAKQFMREAAEAKESGIPRDKLSIALEPEAASLYCRHLPVDKFVGQNKMQLGSFKPGTKYLVLDAGGGTVDITVHEVNSNGTLKELHKASGGAWGGTKVDEAFSQFLIKLVGAPVMKTFKESRMDDFIDLFRDFEIKKRDIGPSKEGKITIRIPAALTTLFTKQTGENLDEVIPNTAYANQIKIMGDKMRVDAHVFKAFFDGPVKSIVDHVKTLLQQPAVRGCAAIVMVGGFSESPMLQENIRKNFPRLKVIIPDEAGLAVLKGAVIYGHSPTTIAERVCKYTYGTDAGHAKSEKCNHPPGKTSIQKDGSIRCDDIFSIHVRVGDTVNVGKELDEQVYVPTSVDQTAIGCDIFATSSANPHLTTELGSQKIGTFSVPLPLASGTERSVGMSMKFGGTEIEVKVVDKTTGKVSTKLVNFLG